MNRILEKTAAQFPNVYFVDLHGRILRKYFYDDCHLSLAGKNQKARTISKFIIDHAGDFGW